LWQRRSKLLADQPRKGQGALSEGRQGGAAGRVPAGEKKPTGSILKKVLARKRA